MQSFLSCRSSKMISKRFCFVILAVVVVLALTSATEARDKLAKKKLNQARCGGTVSVLYLDSHLKQWLRLARLV